jgi:hypothetical protein
MDLVEEAIYLDFYGTDFYMWVDAGIRHRLFREQDKFKLYPDPKKIEEMRGIRILCRSFPQENDLNLKCFYKSHQHRFGAGVIAGEKNKIRKFNELMRFTLDEALSLNLIDSEQSLHTVCYLRNKDLFELIISEDWYYHFDYYLPK